MSTKPEKTLQKKKEEYVRMIPNMLAFFNPCKKVTNVVLNDQCNLFTQKKETTVYPRTEVWNLTKNKSEISKGKKYPRNKHATSQS